MDVTKSKALDPSMREALLKAMAMTEDGKDRTDVLTMLDDHFGFDSEEDMKKFAVKCSDCKDTGVIMWPITEQGHTYDAAFRCKCEKGQSMPSQTRSGRRWASVHAVNPPRYSEFD